MATKLRFGPTTKVSGFTALSSALFNDLRPARIVRELIQNSLDAAVEAGEPTARVEFSVAPITDRDIPDLAEYERHFNGAVKAKEKGSDPLTANEGRVVKNIRAALKRLHSKEGAPCLFVLDNGVGLDEERMTSLLGDGASVKGEGASGSFGVGHLAPISASDLRYALYGGVDKKGKRVASGYATLASRPGSGDYMFSADGYLVEGFTNGANGKLPYRFMNSRAIPNIIKARLDKIRQDFGHGSVIAIPAFNYFGDKRTGKERESLRDVALKVAAYNFSAAIQEGKLSVAVFDDDGEGRPLNRETLESVLAADKDKSRSVRGGFYRGLQPSGQNAYSAYLALSRGDSETVHTTEGDLEVRLMTNPHCGNTRIDLFRNGMRITDDIPRLGRSRFADRQPFHAVLILNAPDGGNLHSLIRNAEGPMHDELSSKRLGDEESRLRDALGQVADAIRNIAPEISSEEYTPDDYLVVDMGGDSENGGRRKFEIWGAPTVIPRGARSRGTSGGGGGGGGNGGGGGGGGGGRTRSRRPSRPLPFRATAVPVDKGRHVVSLACDSDIEAALFSLRIDENTDATCDRIWTDEEVSVKSFRIESEGSDQTGIGRLEDDGKTIRMRGLSANANYSVTVDYDVPDGFSDAVSAPVFRVELHRPPPPPPPPPAMQGKR